MVLKEITYFHDGEEKRIKVIMCGSFLSKVLGLMFKNNSLPLLFIFNREKKLSIHSFFCKPFRAIWLDDKMSSTKVLDIYNWRFNFSGFGRYLLEVPIPLRRE